jgi:hypothetical protein
MDLHLGKCSFSWLYIIIIRLTIKELDENHRDTQDNSDERFHSLEDIHCFDSLAMSIMKKLRLES